MESPETTASLEPLHGGWHAINAAIDHGAQAMFTLSGAHIFPLFDAAVGGKESALAMRAGNTDDAESNLPLIDVRHEQTAVFAAEAVGKLTRTPGFAAVTAGPGVTNTVSAITGAFFNGSPVVLIGGRAPDYRWGSGALQELDHVPIMQSVTKKSWTVHDPGAIGPAVSHAFHLARTPHQGPVFVDIPMDVLYTPSSLGAPVPRSDIAEAARPGSAEGDLQSTIEEAGVLLCNARRPVLVIGSDTWLDDAVDAIRTFIREWRVPTIANGMGRGILPPSDPLLVTRARSRALAESDLVIVAGAPLDFRLNYGSFGDHSDGQTAPTPVIHIVHGQSPGSPSAPHVRLLGGHLATTLETLSQSAGQLAATNSRWGELLAEATQTARASDADLMASDANPIHPARIYGELLPRITANDIIIGDGGDFVSFAGRFIEPEQPGRWLDPGPFGCLGTGPGYALGAHVAHPDAHLWMLLGDGAAGFSLMDAHTLIRHNVPVTMVVANNAGWGLERHPMRFLYGYDVAAELGHTSYDGVVRALGGAGETIDEASHIGPALDRARDHAGPYLVNVMTDPEIPYPRSTTGI